MGMPAVAREWTAGMVRALPDDGNRYEVVDGELLVTPATTYRHQAIMLELLRQLDGYMRRSDSAAVLFSPADIEFDARTLVQPDLFVYPLRKGKKPRDWSDMSHLLLVIEVLSPGTARYDRQVKRRRYQRQGVPEYWIVDSDARLIERWRAQDERPEILADAITWQAEGAGESLTIDLPLLFAEVLD